jgi:hypothetical protein
MIETPRPKAGRRYVAENLPLVPPFLTAKGMVVHDAER